MNSKVDSAARRIYRDIQREKAQGHSAESPSVEAHNRGVDYRLQRLRDRAEFGENLENVF